MVSVMSYTIGGTMSILGDGDPRFEEAVDSRIARILGDRSTVNLTLEELLLVKLVMLAERAETANTPLAGVDYEITDGDNNRIAGYPTPPALPAQVRRRGRPRKDGT